MTIIASESRSVKCWALRGSGRYELVAGWDSTWSFPLEMSDDNGGALGNVREILCTVMKADVAVFFLRSILVFTVKQYKLCYHLAD